ncbi:transposase [Streptomyces olivoreticuli]|uniref:transposase n=1 Tax=Streptomyces olivoreticuli TaxID=68246 RepID=UPI002659F2E4|nr:transposase [Streptomyces olivoreticuli]WKK27729.1 transposase [Streptomyces olivoreticuli]
MTITPLLPPGGKHHQRKAWFTAKQCTICPLSPRCTTAKGGRVVAWQPHHHMQEAARQQAADPHVAG